MPRKPRPDQEPEDQDVLAEGEEEVSERPFRNEHRARMMALKDLGNRIAKLPPGMRRDLPMSDALRVEIEALVEAGERPDRRRVLMRVQRQLGVSDIARLEAALTGDTPAAALERRLAMWRTRILEGGDPAIQDFVAEHPAADRQAIRSLAREARGEGSGAKSASNRLLQKLREAAAGA